MTDHQPRWDRLGARVVDRMEVLNLTQSQLAKRAKVSTPTVRGIMKGEPRGEPTSHKLRQLVVALWWTVDSIDLLLGGAEPRTPNEVVEQVRRARQWMAEAADRGETRLVEAYVASIAEDMRVLEATAETARQIGIDPVWARDLDPDGPGPDGATSAVSQLDVIEALQREQALALAEMAGLLRDVVAELRRLRAAIEPPRSAAGPR